MIKDIKLSGKNSKETGLADFDLHREGKKMVTPP